MLNFYMDCGFESEEEFFEYLNQLRDKALLQDDSDDVVSSFAQDLSASFIEVTESIEGSSLYVEYVSPEPLNQVRDGKGYSVEATIVSPSIDFFYPFYIEEDEEVDEYLHFIEEIEELDSLVPRGQHIALKSGIDQESNSILSTLVFSNKDFWLAAAAQDEFTVVIEDAGSQKIAVIKEVRALNSSLGLKEAKDLVDSAPATVLEKADKATADKAKAALEAAGAKVSIDVTAAAPVAVAAAGGAAGGGEDDTWLSTIPVGLPKHGLNLSETDLSEQKFVYRLFGKISGLVTANSASEAKQLFAQVLKESFTFIETNYDFLGYHVLSDGQEKELTSNESDWLIPIDHVFVNIRK